MSMDAKILDDPLVLASEHDDATTFGPLLVFNPKQAALIHAFAQATLPTGDAVATVQEARVVQRLDEELSFVHPSIRDDFLKIIKALEFMPKFMGHPAFFSKLTPEQRIAFLNSTLNTKSEEVRAALNALRMAVCMMYYGHPSTWKQIHYDGPFMPYPEKPGVQHDYYVQQINEKKA